MAVTIIVVGIGQDETEELKLLEVKIVVVVVIAGGGKLDDVVVEVLDELEDVPSAAEDVLEAPAAVLVLEATGDVLELRAPEVVERPEDVLLWTAVEEGDEKRLLPLDWSVEDALVPAAALELVELRAAAAAAIVEDEISATAEELPLEETDELAKLELAMDELGEGVV